jgi:hypothetical protein
MVLGAPNVKSRGTFVRKWQGIMLSHGEGDAESIGPFRRVRYGNATCL